MNPILRAATFSDLPAIMKLERSGFVPGIVEEESVFENRLRQFHEGFFLLTDGTDGPALGYATTEIWKGRAGFSLAQFELGHDLSRWHDPQGDELYLASMTVDPACRGAGLGKILFAETLAAMSRGFPRLNRATLLVNETWAHALRIYRGHGFVEEHFFPGFFTPVGQVPQGAWVMVRPSGGAPVAPSP